MTGSTSLIPSWIWIALLAFDLPNPGPNTVFWDQVSYVGEIPNGLFPVSLDAWNFNNFAKVRKLGEKGGDVNWIELVASLVVSHSF